MKYLILILSSLFLCENSLAASAETPTEDATKPKSAVRKTAIVSEADESEAPSPTSQGRLSFFKKAVQTIDEYIKNVGTVNEKIKTGEKISDEDKETIKEAILTIKSFADSKSTSSMVEALKNYSGILLSDIKTYVEEGGKLDEANTKTYIELLEVIELPTD